MCSVYERQQSNHSQSTEPPKQQPTPRETDQKAAVIYRIPHISSGVQPLPSANHLQLRNNRLLTETVTHTPLKEIRYKPDQKTKTTKKNQHHKLRNHISIHIVIPPLITVQP